MGVSLPQGWQQIDGRWHVCHSWQHLDRDMITAMTFLLELLAVSVVVLLVALGIYLVDYVRDDGYRRTARRTPPASHHSDAFARGSRLA
jgi:hypothetical protein